MMELTTVTPGPGIRLKNPWLFIVRLVWIVLAPMHILIGIFSLPLFFQQINSPSLNGIINGWTPQTLAIAMAQLGLSPRLLSGYLIVRSLVLAISLFTIGIFIFWKKSDELIGLFISYVLVGLSGIFIGSGPDFLAAIPNPWQLIITYVGVLIWPAFFIFFFLFPDGRFVPRWTRWFAPFWFIFAILLQAITGNGGPTPVSLLILAFVSISVSIYSQFFRYLRISSPLERQQTRWFLFAIAILFVTAIMQSLYPILFPVLTEPGPLKLVADIISRMISDLVILLVPLSIAIAMFRYHLWNIDIIIRRTLIYGALSVTLALIYFGGILLMQGFFQVLTNQQQSSLAIVISTLAIAAIFSPLHRRIQSDIDRRFYRSKYDADKILKTFAGSVRNEVELEQLTSHLIKVVDETIQPENVSLWLRQKPTGKESE